MHRAVPKPRGQFGYGGREFLTVLAILAFLAFLLVHQKVDRSDREGVAFMPVDASQ